MYPFIHTSATAAAADDLKSIRRVPRQQQQREDDGWVKSAGNAVRGVGTKIKAAASRVVEHVREAARNFILPSTRIIINLHKSDSLILLNCEL